MKKSTLVVIVLVVVALAAGGLFALSGRDDDTKSQQESTTSTDHDQQATDGGNGLDEDQAATNEVEIEDFAFGPSSITVKKGTTVTWTNKDSVQHSVVPDEESDNFQAGPLLSKNVSYSFTFNTPGTYTYHCGPHPQMTGSVVVTE